MQRLRKVGFENGLGIFFGVIFLATLVAQAIVGHRVYNEEQLAHHGQAITLGRYLTSSHFGQAVMENWQSEFLQFSLYVLTTVWLVQKGSPESKPLDQAGTGSDTTSRFGGWRDRIYENSLLIVMLAIWLGSWFAQSVNGWSVYNANQIEHHQATVKWLGYAGSSDFWEATLQNWQSEFLAVGSFAVFGIYQRQRGSPESKDVADPPEKTGTD
jgi:hypothetical protein